MQLRLHSDHPQLPVLEQGSRDNHADLGGFHVRGINEMPTLRELTHEGPNHAEYSSKESTNEDRARESPFDTETLHAKLTIVEAIRTSGSPKDDSLSVRIHFRDPQTLRSLSYFDSQDSDESSHELDELDQELNVALKQPTFMVTLKYRKKPLTPPSLMPKITPKIEHDTLSLYKPVPKNIVPIIEREMGQVECDDDFGTVEKVVFSLKDPLSATRIKIPVKSSRCIHFECFDFDTFCIFNKIPKGVLNLTKKDMSKRSYQRLAHHHEAVVKETKNTPQKVKHEFITIIDDPTPMRRHSLPKYKCPLCDLEFVLAELYFSNLLNYFVKTIPSNINKVELLDCKSFRPIEDIVFPITSAAEPDGDNFVILSSDDELDNEIKHSATSNNDPAHHDETFADDTDNLLDDGLDDLFLSLGSHTYSRYGLETSANYESNPQPHHEVESGSGSWNDPVTLD